MKAASVAAFLALAVSVYGQQETPGSKPPPPQARGPSPPKPQSAKAPLERAAEEFRVQTRNLGLREDSPRSAGQAGASSSQFHGRLFYNIRNNALDAVPHEIVQRGGSRGLLQRNQFGFNVSGPVVLPRLFHGGQATFFSLTFEGVREKVARTYLRTIPTLGERSGDWAHVVDLAGQPLPIYDPETTAANPSFDAARPVTAGNLQYIRAPFPGSRIPQSRLDPESQRALTLYPAPNTDAGPFFRNNYFILAPEINRADGWIGRLDHIATDRHRVGLGVNWSDGEDGAAPWFPNAANPGPVSRARRNRRVSAEHVFTASPRSVNTLTAEVSTDQFANRPRLDERGQPFPQYTFEPYLPMGRSYPVSRNARNSSELTNSFSTRWRTHRPRAILRLARDQVNTFWPQYPSGNYRFSAGLTSLPGIVNTGHAFASFLLGGAEFAETSVVTSPSYFRRSRFLAAFRDQWEFRPGLTVNLGLNIDVNSPRVEKYDRQSTIDLRATNPVNGRPGALVVAGTGGRGRAFQPWQNKLEPSASLSWSVFGSTRNVLRLAYSRSYSPIPIYLGQWGTQAFNGTPTLVSVNPQLAPAVLLRDGIRPSRAFPDLRPEAANNTVADLIEPDGRQPTYNSASLSFERELPFSVIVTLGAGHSDGRNLLLGNSGSNPNAIPLSALQYRDRLNDENFNRSLRPFPHYQRFDVYSSWPEGKYRRDSGYLRLEKRTSAGLSLTAYYEFSKQMDNYSGPYGVQDYYNRRNEWSLTSSAVPQQFSLSYMYELPMGANKPFLAVTDWRRFLVDGWSVSGQSTVVAGEPLALRPQFNNTGGVVDALRVNAVPGADPHVSNPGPELWFNPAAFAQPPDFTVGEVSRTHPTLRAPGNQNHDLSLNKRFPVSQEKSVEFSAVGLNFLNQANWTDPDTIIGPAAAPNVNAGRIVGSRGSRIIQLGLRFNF